MTRKNRSSEIALSLPDSETFLLMSLLGLNTTRQEWRRKGMKRLPTTHSAKVRWTRRFVLKRCRSMLNVIVEMFDSIFVVLAIERRDVNYQQNSNDWMPTALPMMRWIKYIEMLFGFEKCRREREREKESEEENLNLPIYSSDRLELRWLFIYFSTAKSLSLDHSF